MGFLSSQDVNWISHVGCRHLTWVLNLLCHNACNKCETFSNKLYVCKKMFEREGERQRQRKLPCILVTFLCQRRSRLLLSKAGIWVSHVGGRYSPSWIIKAVFQRLRNKKLNAGAGAKYWTEYSYVGCRYLNRVFATRQKYSTLLLS